jgi:hypothetical protein
MAEPDRPDRDIDLVFITGAGASCEFGIGGKKLPLMSEWSDALVDKLFRANTSYQKATGLTKQLSGPKFEQTLGHFLRVVQAFPTIESILEPSRQFQTIGGLNNDSVLKEWYSSTNFHLKAIVKLIHESLYESFGSNRIDYEGATRAYEALFAQLGIGRTQRLVYATTNYDSIGEYALDQLGWLPDWGTPHNSQPNGGEQPLRVEGLLDGIPRYAPVLHLHGSIGWFQREDKAISNGSTSYNEGDGIAMIMLPDPDKDYGSNPIIVSLWSEFQTALRRAKRILVLGHSLNDQALVAALRDNVDRQERIAIAVYDSGSGEPVDPLPASLESAVTIPLRFARDMGSITAKVNEWQEHLDKALRKEPA